MKLRIKVHIKVPTRNPVQTKPTCVMQIIFIMVPGQYFCVFGMKITIAWGNNLPIQQCHLWWPTYLPLLANRKNGEWKINQLWYIVTKFWLFCFIFASFFLYFFLFIYLFFFPLFFWLCFITWNFKEIVHLNTIFAYIK